MITAEFAEYNKTDFVDKFEKDFETEDLMWAWLRNQPSHTYVSLRLSRFWEKGRRPASMASSSGPTLADVIPHYARTFTWLQAYDDGTLAEPKPVPGGVLPTYPEACAAITLLKQTLMAKGEASELFGNEREEGLASILGNLDQSVFGAPAYPSVESKAAHLLYFVVKDHPFSDGNKRIGALLFAGFLHINGRLTQGDGVPVLNEVGLAALCLLVAASKPTDKEILIRLIMNMLEAS